MSIERNQLGQLDFSDVTVHGQLALVRPGDILRHDFMEPRGLSANALARGLNVPANRITGILAGSHALTADTALRLERYFGMSAVAWLALQKIYELETARQANAQQIAEEVHTPASPSQIEPDTALNLSDVDDKPSAARARGSRTAHRP